MMSPATSRVFEGVAAQQSRGEILAPDRLVRKHVQPLEAAVPGQRLDQVEVGHVLSERVPPDPGRAARMVDRKP
jgi:hypothetical protein